MTLLHFIVGIFGCGMLLSGLKAEPSRGYLRHPAIHGETIVFTAEGDLWRGTIHGGLAQRLTTHPGVESHAAISPDGRILAFSGQYEGPTEMYTMPMEGGVPTRRTYEGVTAQVVGWARDGEVLFTTAKYSTLPNQQLVRFELSTGTRTVVPLHQASDGVFDAEGRLFFTRLPFQGSSTKRYKGGTAQNLWRFDQSGHEAIRLLDDFAGTSKNPMLWQGRVYFLTDLDGTMNVWSIKMDGTERKQHTRHQGWDVKHASLSVGRIVYSVGADLRLLELDTEQDRALSFRLPSDFDQQRDRWIKRPIEYLTAAHISPDGSRVALTARGQVFVAPVREGRFVEVTHNPSVRYRDVKFLNKTNLVGMTDQTGEIEFCKLPANGVGVPEPVTTGGKVFRWDHLASPDGKWLAFHDKDDQLWIWNFDQKKETLVERSSDGGFSEYSWSPDSQWLVYVRAAKTDYRQVVIYSPSDGRKADVTTDRVDSYSPSWSPDGKWLYFLSDREIRSVIGSPWGPRQPEPFYDQITQIYQLPLVTGLRSPFDADDEVYLAAKGETKDGKEKEPARDAEKKSEEENASKPVENKSGKTNIELDGLITRARLVPVPAGNYENLVVTPKHLLWVKRDRGFNSRSDLQQLEMKNDDPKPKTLIEDIRFFEVTPDGKKFLVRKGDALHVINSDSGAPAKLEDGNRVNLDGWSFPVNPRDEWRQMFTESWRLMRDYFYDRNMHGVNWQAMLERYLPLVDRVTDRAELSDLMSDMMGELSALHIFVRNGDMRELPDRIQAAAFGAELVRDESANGWRVLHIYRADPDYPDQQSPLAHPNVDIKEGDVLVEINGVSIFSVPQPEILLRNKAGKQVLLGYKKKGEDKQREVIFRPITAGQESNLRYSEWEYTRRLKVEEESNQQIGYVHLRAMGAANIAEWAREYYPVYKRQGLIIDVRHNRGGNIDSWILSKLLRKAWFYWQGRTGNPTWNMQYAFRGHMVVICNEFTASDGEAFAEGFRRLGLGKVIGTRTWGGEIWLTFSNFLVDKGIASAAEIGVYGPEGQWLIEGHGVDPDIVVDNLPHATFTGSDAQLDAAIKHLQELIEKDPRPVPTAPPHPDKSFRFASEPEDPNANR